jgi:hypothetical protein
MVPGIRVNQHSRGGATRTLNRRFWRPVLYQLSYTPSTLVAAYCTEFSLRLEASNGERGPVVYENLSALANASG